ncbi:hypothetical protein C8J57DRAFT_1252446 [Mycena rebaudengoi]|nr:hypothetical protein C8J57DRAFT_1252446 [Mycena rebaudengoi]
MPQLNFFDHNELSICWLGNWVLGINVLFYLVHNSRGCELDKPEPSAGRDYSMHQLYTHYQKFLFCNTAVPAKVQERNQSPKKITSKTVPTKMREQNRSSKKLTPKTVPAKMRNRINLQKNSPQKLFPPKHVCTQESHRTPRTPAHPPPENAEDNCSQ